MRQMKANSEEKRQSFSTEQERKDSKKCNTQTQGCAGNL